MKLRNRELVKVKMAYLGLVLLVSGLIVLFYWAGIRPQEDGWLVIGIIIAITALYSIPFLFTNFAVRRFDKYYKNLTEAEKERFERELEEGLASQLSGQEFVITSKEIVITNFLALNIIAIEDVVVVRRLYSGNGRLMLSGVKDFLGAINGTSQYPVEKIMQDLWKVNPMIMEESLK